jgi:hypothetical protein
VDGTVKTVEVTFNVTGMFKGLPPEDVIWILPLSVPEVRPAVFTETAKVAGVVPLPGVTLSQEFPELTAALTWVALGAVIDKVWEAGAAAPGA